MREDILNMFTSFNFNTNTVLSIAALTVKAGRDALVLLTLAVYTAVTNEWHTPKADLLIDTKGHLTVSRRAGADCGHEEGAVILGSIIIIIIIILSTCVGIFNF
jgi:hypothetical protein